MKKNTESLFGTLEDTVFDLATIEKKSQLHCHDWRFETNMMSTLTQVFDPRFAHFSVHNHLILIECRSKISARWWLLNTILHKLTE